VLAQDVPTLDWAGLGVLGTLVLLVVVTGVKKIWVFKWAHDVIVGQLEAELARERTARIEWQTLALTQAGMLERTVEKTTEIVRKVTAEGGPS
jgi:cell division protein FtsL